MRLHRKRGCAIPAAGSAATTPSSSMLGAMSSTASVGRQSPAESGEPAKKPAAGKNARPTLLRQLTQDAVVNPVLVPPLHRVHLHPVHLHAEVEMIAQRQSGRIAFADYLALL